MLTLNNLKSPKGAHRNTKRIGRGQGSGWGTQAGKGHKGQKARSGGGVMLGFEGGQMPIYRRLPKRGFKNIFAKKIFAINLGKLQLAIDNKKIDSKEITEQDLFKAKLVNKSNGEIKILSQGKFKSVINLSVSYASKPAIDKVKKLGGNINLTKKVKGN